MIYRFMENSVEKTVSDSLIFLFSASAIPLLLNDKLNENPIRSTFYLYIVSRNIEYEADGGRSH